MWLPPGTKGTIKSSGAIYIISMIVCMGMGVCVCV